MQYNLISVGVVFFSSALICACSLLGEVPKAGGLAPPTNAQSCPAGELQGLVGQSRTVLQTMRFGTEVRFEESGQMYTADFVATRTRIIIDANGKIVRVMCG